MLNFDDFEVLTFDCYGTLIDWETGILEVRHPVFSAHGAAQAQPDLEVPDLWSVAQKVIEVGGPLGTAE